MSRLATLLLFFLTSCSSVKMANNPVDSTSIHVLPIRHEGGALLQRQIATKLIESGYSLNDSNDSSILCRVNVKKDSSSDLTKKFAGKAQRAKHSIALEICLEDRSGKKVIEPFTVSVYQNIGYLDSSNEKSFSVDTYEGRVNTLDYSLGQSDILDESLQRSRVELYEQLAEKIVFHFYDKIDETTFNESLG